MWVWRSSPATPGTAARARASSFSTSSSCGWAVGSPTRGRRPRPVSLHLVIIRHVLSGERLNQYTDHLSPQDRRQAAPMLADLRSALEQRVAGAIGQAYGVGRAVPDTIDTSHGIEDRLQSLSPGFTPGAGGSLFRRRPQARRSPPRAPSSGPRKPRSPIRADAGCGDRRTDGEPGLQSPSGTARGACPPDGHPERGGIAARAATAARRSR